MNSCNLIPCPTFDYWFAEGKKTKNISILNQTVKLLQQIWCVLEPKPHSKRNRRERPPQRSCHHPFSQHPTLRSSDYTFRSVLSVPLVNFSW